MGIMKKKMETTIMGYIGIIGYIVLGVVVVVVVVVVVSPGCWLDGVRFRDVITSDPPPRGTDQGQARLSCIPPIVTFIVRSLWYHTWTLFSDVAM